MKILLVGGGSGGPVSPLLAVAEEIQKAHPQAKFLLVGTKKGPEADMARKAAIPFITISAGKLRRYFSIKNLFSGFLTLTGFFQAIKILKSFKPDCVFGTGSYVQVPVVWAAWFLKIPVVLHQQDIVPSLANKISQFTAEKITVTFDISVKDFSSNFGFFYKKHKDKVIHTGNPCRPELKLGDKHSAEKYFNLKPNLPTLLVLGGGTGALFLNNLIDSILPQLSKSVQIIHSTGKGKMISNVSENYHPFEFIDNMADAYAKADIVLARAGLSTITELSNLKKLGIIVPMPKSHQELNALYLFKTGSAIVLSQSKVTADNFVALVRKLLFAYDLQTDIKANISKLMPHNAAEKISEIVVELALKK